MLCGTHLHDNLSRLVEDEERLWTNENIDMVALKHFPSIDRDTSLKRPILYSNWLSKDYIPVDQEELREYVKARLKVCAAEVEAVSVKRSCLFSTKCMLSEDLAGIVYCIFV